MAIRFNKYRRMDLVDRIMQDVPDKQKEYADAMKDRALAYSLEQAPEAIRKVWADKTTRPYLSMRSLWFCCMSLPTMGLDTNDSEAVEAFKNDPELQRLHKLHDEEKEKRTAIRQALITNANACTTYEVFAERFPALAKYLPVWDTPPDNLPATTSLMDDLKAAGFKAEAQ